MLKADAQRSWDTPSLIGAVVFLLFGCLVMGLRLNADPGAPMTGEQVLAAAAFGCLYASPGIVALASGGRGSLLVASGLLGLCLIPTSFSITPLLVVPSILVLVGAGRSPDLAPIRTLIVTAIVVGAGIGAFLLLFIDPQTVCWSITVSGQVVGGGCDGGAVPPLRSAAAVALTAGGVAAALAFGRRRGPTRAPAPGRPSS